MLEKQKDLGLEVSTDGELRRSNFMSDFTEAVEGFDLETRLRDIGTMQPQAAQQPATSGQQRHRNRESASAPAASRLPGASCHSCDSTLQDQSR